MDEPALASAEVTELVAAVARAIDGATGPVVIGFSGGLDSTVLLHAAVRAVAVPRIVALHVNHGLQAEAATWERACAQVAAALGVAFVARRVAVQPTGSLEAAARGARYRAFASFLTEAGARLLLAHHRDDQAETVLLRLLQGRGLYGMPAARPLGEGQLVRPFLDVPRDLLLRYARQADLVWHEDPSNADLSLDRNFVRHRVLTALRVRFPDVATALLNAAAARRAEEAWLLRRPPAPLDTATVSIDDLLAYGPDEQLTWLRLWLTEHGHALPSRRALDALLGQLQADPDRQPRLALAHGSLRRYGGRLWLVGSEPEPELASSYRVPEGGCLRLPHGTLTVVADATGFTATGPLEVRFRAGGERIRVGGRHRLLKQLLHQAGLPPWARARHPLLFDADGLAAVPGIAARDAHDALARPRYRVDWVPDA